MQGPSERGDTAFTHRVFHTPSTGRFFLQFLPHHLLPTGHRCGTWAIQPNLPRAGDEAQPTTAAGPGVTDIICTSGIFGRLSASPCHFSYLTPMGSVEGLIHAMHSSAMSCHVTMFFLMLSLSFPPCTLVAGGPHDPSLLHRRVQHAE